MSRKIKSLSLGDTIFIEAVQITLAQIGVLTPQDQQMRSVDIEHKKPDRVFVRFNGANCDVYTAAGSFFKILKVVVYGTPSSFEGELMQELPYTFEFTDSVHEWWLNHTYNPKLDILHIYAVLQQVAEVGLIWSAMFDLAQLPVFANQEDIYPQLIYYFNHDPVLSSHSIEKVVMQIRLGAQGGLDTIKTTALC